jgi:hypothetical protein
MLQTSFDLGFEAIGHSSVKAWSDNGETSAWLVKTKNSVMLCFFVK